MRLKLMRLAFAVLTVMAALAPVRTRIQTAHLNDRVVYLFLTHRGNYNEADARAITTWLERHGAREKGLYALRAEKLPEARLREETKRPAWAICW